MTYQEYIQEYIRQHMIAADYRENKSHQCEAVPMISKENAEKACELAVCNFAQDLLPLCESARKELLKKVIIDFKTKYGNTEML